MLQNFIKVALRSFLRHRFYSVINVVGLSSGLACALFIFLWVRDEVQMDKFHADSNRLYRVVSNVNTGAGELITWEITPGPLADEIRASIPEAELAVRTMDNNATLFQFEEKSFLEKGIYADADFFKLFSFKIKTGTTDPVRDKSSVAISQRLAKNLFGDADPIGKIVKVSKSYDLEVKGVFEEAGAQSSIQFDFVLPFEIYKEQRGDGFNWGNFDHPLYLKLKDESQAQVVTNKLNGLADKQAAEEDKGDLRFYMQPFTERYLHGQFENGVPVGGRIKYVQIFSLVAVFILIIACINFMNMATAKAATRAKEVGVRKTAGAQRISLIVQFVSESILISVVALIVALGLVFLILPVFNSIVNKNMVLELTDPMFLFMSVAIVLITGILAGSYPAFFLSSYKPVAVLKGNTNPGFSGAALRKGLVVFQFTLTVILIASALVVYNQIEFIRNTNLGYQRESVISFGTRGKVRGEFDAFKNEAMQIPGVQMVSKANSSLVKVENQNSSVNWAGKDPEGRVYFRTVVVDYDFIETMGLKVIQGRPFAKSFNDTNNFVITKKALETMGLKDPVGHKISQWGTEGTIVGVIEDFHSRSLHEAMDPVVLLCQPEWTSRGFVRFDGKQTAQVVASLKQIYNRYNPEYPFEYSFVDDDFEKLYNNEKVTGSLAIGFTGMAILISGLGLLGLAAYTTERRRKEISIRKTLGASVGSLVSMMSKDFVQLSLIAAIIGSPIAYYLMNQFLEGYAYHTELSWPVFGITAVSVIIISLSIVAYQVLKASIANPVDALKNE